MSEQKRTLECRPEPPRPDLREVQRYGARWREDAELTEPEKMLQTLFTKTCPRNTDLGEIMLKAAALNTVYNTHIYSLYPMAQHILALDIDARLAAGDETLVNELMRVTYSDGRKIDHYSFASKYCSFHNPWDYPIYDSFVDKVLRYYRDREGFCAFKDSDLKNYPKFKQVLREFCRHFGLEEFNTKELDCYLWQFGKEYF